MDPLLPRPPAADQSVGEHRAVGAADPALPADDRVPLAGGPHRARRRGGRGTRGAPDARRVPDVRRGVDGDAGAHRRQDRHREVRRGPAHLRDRGPDAGQQVAAGRHVAPPRPEFREGVRRAVPDRGWRPGARRRRRDRLPAQAGADPGRHRADLPDRHGARGGHAGRGGRGEGAARRRAARGGGRQGRDEAGRQVLRVGRARRPAAARGGSEGRGQGPGLRGPAHGWQGADPPRRTGGWRATHAQRDPDGAVPCRAGAARPQQPARGHQGRTGGDDGRRGRPCEDAIKEATKATVRVLPDEEFRSPVPPASCVWCGAPSVVEAVWAKAY